ncbi:hypothetical protein LWC08_03760 [Desulfobaculum bizertense]|uniref:hypothetical protein n=1 Tax=Desulfobaculum bizertense TaxID=376490 RepID=UPI001F25AE0C|nr:hypothetical protein [Desulfobaculum bizertense]UIJ38695.1 hypothetical protein LWC08_03760 [Desulfobaculum bizertense]
MDIEKKEVIMSFFIPWVMIGVGSGFCAWGVQQIFRGDDSADIAAKKVLCSLPDNVQKYVESVEITEKGLKFKFRNGTPKEIEDEVKEQIQKA